MSVADIADDTEVTTRLEALGAAREESVLRRITLLGASGFSVGICVLGWLVGGGFVLGGMVPPAGMRITGTVVTLTAVILFGVAILRDYVDRRLAASEIRTYGRIQAEVYRMERRLDKMETLLARFAEQTVDSQATIRDEIALLRAEMLALLGSIPEGVVNYGNGCATDARLAAMRELAGTAPTERINGNVPHLRAVTDRTQN